MNKRVGAVVVAMLLIGGSAIGAAIAQQSSIAPPPYPYSEYPKVRMTEGIAFNKETNETEQVVFLIMEYSGEKQVYLIIGDEAYGMKEISKIDDPNSGTRVYFYESEDGDVLTILVQRFERWGIVSVSGDFKDYLITFKPSYWHPYYPLKAEQTIEKTPTPRAPHVVPVKRGWRKIASEKIKGIDKWLQKAKPIEW